MALDKFKIFEPDENGKVTGELNEQIGVSIVRRALEEPLRQIARNAGQEGAVIVEKVRAERNANFGTLPRVCSKVSWPRALLTLRKSRPLHTN